MRSILRSPYFRRLVIAAVVAALILAATAISYVSRSTASPPQPMPFPHQRMVQAAGVQCTFCHTTATKSPAPGMPSVEKCMGCHKIIAKDRPAIQQLASYAQNGEAIPWVRINRLQRYVHFPHNVHVTAGGLNCERCHGDVGSMTQTHQVVVMNMGWCLDCHQQQPNARQLTDCVVCHY